MKKNTNKTTNKTTNQNYHDAGLVYTVDAFQEIKRIAAARPELLEAWKDSENEYELIFDIINIRKATKLTKKELADLAKTKQEVISRMESRKNSPSLSTFCRIANSLGYQVSLIKKDE